MPYYHFISYSATDTEEFALKLADDLQAGPPSFPVWIFRRELHAAAGDWDAQIREAIRDCDSLIFVMSRDSVTDESNCKPEWTAALKFKKPILLARLHADADAPFRIASRQYIDFVGDYKTALAKLRNDLQWLHSPEGELRALEFRLKDAVRDFERASDADRPRIQADIELLRKQVAAQTEVVKNPDAAARRTDESIKAGIERERRPPPLSATGEGRGGGTKFINPPPLTAPRYFQDRHVENKIVADFLRDDACRMLTINGRAGIGKTAMVCRLLKALESGQLPDDLGALSVDGIVYLSAIGTRTINTPNLFADLCQLLPADVAQKLDALYRDPKISTHNKMLALLEKFPRGRVVVLLDNFESVMDATTCCVQDAELDDALRAILSAPHHAVKLILTTRIPPRELELFQPGCQKYLAVDAGLEASYAKRLLREMDADGRVGLKNADDALLQRACERTRGFPRALEALYAILSADRYTSLEEILGVGAFLKTPLQPPLPENVVEAMVGEAFSRLDPTAQRVMQSLAAYARPVSAAALDYLLQPFVASVDSAPVLNRLVNMQFAHRESGKYYLHPADREYAWSRVTPTPTLPRFQSFDSAALRSGSKTGEGANSLPLFGEFPNGGRAGDGGWTQRDLLTRAADYFAQTRKPRETWKTLADLEPQLNEFDLRCAAEDYDTAASVVLEIDGEYLLLWGHYRLMVEMHEKLQGKISDADLKRQSVGNLGQALAAIGNTRRAISCYEQALANARERKNRQAEGVWLGNLGNAYSALGETRRAIQFYEQALAIDREIGDKRGEGAGLGNLGNRYAELGETRRAIQFYEQALAIACEIGDKRGEGNHLGNLGSAYSELGEMRRAIAFYEQALAIAREIGDRRGEGIRLGNLGNRYAELGETRRAIQFYEQALAIAREIGDKRGESFDLNNKADVLVDQNKFDDATESFKQAACIADEIGLTTIQNYARWGLALAQLYAVQTDLTGFQNLSGLQAARAAAESARQYDEPQNNHNVLALLGVIALRQAAVNPKGLRDSSGLGDAREAFTAAIQHADALLAQTPELYDALDAKGVALCGLSLCGTGEGKGAIQLRPYVSDAVAAFRAARAINRDAGIVARVAWLLDALALADPNGTEKLTEARRAASGE